MIVLFRARLSAGAQADLSFQQNMLAFYTDILYNRMCLGISPNGKATDSDSVISRFESWYPCLDTEPYGSVFFCVNSNNYMYLGA